MAHAIGNKTENGLGRYEQVYHAFRKDGEACPSWLNEVRRKGLEEFLRHGFPTTRHEDWRYTNVRNLAKTEFLPFRREERAAPFDIEVPPPLEPDAVQLVFRHGQFQPTLSSTNDFPETVSVTSLSSFFDSENLPVHVSRANSVVGSSFAALNAAFVTDGVVIKIPSGIRLDRPIELVFLSDAVSSPKMAHYRNSISLGEGSSAIVVERFVGGQAIAPCLNNIVTAVSLADGASLDQYKLQQESDATFHLATTHVEQSAASDYRSHYFSFGGALVRNEINCSLDGEQVECTLNGVYQAHGNQHMDQRTRIDHAMPNCNSHEVYKGILHDQSHGVFNGKIYVHPDAQKTDAKQSNQVILLSDDAVIDTKPQLEIYADDVKCTHGATVGDLDAEALHYLRSRGISTELARSLLIYAFANEVVQNVTLDGVRDYLEGLFMQDQHLEAMEDID